MKITLEIELDENKKIKLSEEEAKNLYEVLKDFFNDQEYKLYPWYPISPTYPNEPIITYYDTNGNEIKIGSTTYRVDYNNNKNKSIT